MANYRESDDEAWEADDPFVELREALEPAYARLPPESIAALLGREGINAEALEDFLGAIKSFGQTVAGAAPQMLPGAIQGATTGATIGGPWGALAGAVAGGALGAMKKPGPTQPAQTMAVVPGAAGAPSAPPTGAASGAPAQLLQVLMRPEIMQSLVAMMLGRLGAQQVSVGSTSAPVGAFANMLGALANQAAAEYHAANYADTDEMPEYLKGPDGECLCDAVNAEERAHVLAQRLIEATWLESQAWSNLYAGEDDDSAYDTAELVEFLAESDDEEGN